MLQILPEEPLKKTENSRLIGKLSGDQPGPLVIFIGGVHGNEPSGVYALEEIFNQLSKDDLKGTLVGLKGNIAALQKSVRFIDKDLNRIWRSESWQTEDVDSIAQEQKEQIELWQHISQLMQDHKGPYYFFDLHTTSCQTVPFLTVNDSLLNRKFIEQFSIPIVLGIEEYLKGPLLSYLNELGYVAFGFEGGQHDDPKAVENHINFVYATLGRIGMIKTEKYHHYMKLLSDANGGLSGFFEIYERIAVPENESFQMANEFLNFQRLKQGETIAQIGNKVVEAQKNTQIFMPLYQQLGDDGFFFVRPISNIFLILSKYIRKYNWLLKVLPGVHIRKKAPHILIVNTKVARFFPKQVFHLFGYRSRKLAKNKLLMTDRETRSRMKEYPINQWKSW